MLLLPLGNLFAQEPQNTFDLAYKSFGVKISVPDGYVAKEVNMIWQGNSENSKIKNGLFTTAAFSSDGQCAILYSMPAYNYITKGVDDSVNGYMGYIYREVFQVHNLIGEDSKHLEGKPSSYDPLVYLNEISGADVRQAFNADKLCYHSAPLSEGMVYGTKGAELSFDSSIYKKAVHVFILKEGGYHYDVLLLLTDKAAKNSMKYIGDLFGTIRFEEEAIKERWNILGKS